MKNILLAALLVLTVSTVSFGQRILINKGDQYLGARIAVGAVAGASMGFVANYETGIEKNIGIGGSFGYAGYSETSGFYDVSYKNIMIMVNGTYHMDVLKVEKLDTWGAVNLGYNIQSASGSYSGFGLPAGAVIPAWSGSASSGVLVGLTANARYMLSKQLYATASVGFGLGILNIGIDYKL